MNNWPHQNSEYIIDSTADWVRRFAEWPEYLEPETSNIVAKELVTRGIFKPQYLVDVGFRDRTRA